jgi:hypothetical protein
MSIYTYKGTQYQIVREKVDKDDKGEQNKSSEIFNIVSLWGIG